MELMNRRDFDRLVIAGEISAMQAIQVKEGICMVAIKKDTSNAYMLQRSDLKPYLWKHVTGPLSYAESRGRSELTFLFREQLSVNDVLSGGMHHV
ncbi:hypothetical protein ICL29_004124 [Salmonella enterica]|nr:hypothetical protein [Salmonella enterica]EHK5999396.1 hypothetical protein [Salmonella enterica]EIF5124615.1 hypothetical protein [Salmonella enterica]EIF5348791.1 hypothetical protein [Salmonella enterica]EIF5657388.1 hypothetical protein [Salmonella enterica]